MLGPLGVYRRRISSDWNLYYTSSCTTGTSLLTCGPLGLLTTLGESVGEVTGPGDRQNVVFVKKYRRW